jgi:hypothetical protein
MVENELGHGLSLVSDRAIGAQLLACCGIIAKLGQYGIIVAAKLRWRRIHARPAMRKAESGDGD